MPDLKYHYRKYEKAGSGIVRSGFLPPNLRNIYVPKTPNAKVTDNFTPGVDSENGPWGRLIVTEVVLKHPAAEGDVAPPVGQWTHVLKAQVRVVGDVRGTNYVKGSGQGENDEDDEQNPIVDTQNFFNDGLIPQSGSDVPSGVQRGTSVSMTETANSTNGAEEVTKDGFPGKAFPKIEFILDVEILVNGATGHFKLNDVAFAEEASVGEGYEFNVVEPIIVPGEPGVYTVRAGASLIRPKDDQGNAVPGKLGLIETVTRPGTVDEEHRFRDLRGFLSVEISAKAVGLGFTPQEAGLTIDGEPANQGRRGFLRINGKYLTYHRFNAYNYGPNVSVPTFIQSDWDPQEIEGTPNVFESPDDPSTWEKSNRGHPVELNIDHTLRILPRYGAPPLLRAAREK